MRFKPDPLIPDYTNLDQVSIPTLSQESWNNIGKVGWVGASGTIIIIVMLLPVGIIIKIYFFSLLAIL